MPVPDKKQQPDTPASPSDLAFRQLLEKLPAAAYTCDAQGFITYFNERAAALWGREPKLNDPADRYCGSFKVYSPDGSPLAHDQCSVAMTLRDRKSYDGHEIVIQRPDGSLWAALAHATPFFDDRGELVGTVNVLIDITDRKRSELAVSQLAAIVDSSDDVIISKNLDGVIQSWNAAAQRLFGYTAEQAVGRHISFLIPPDRLDEEDRILARLRAGERVHHFDTVRLRSDGTPIDVALTISPVRDNTGRIVGASKIVRDISDRKLAEERIYQLLGRLEDANHRKDEFLAVLAHELRNLLAPHSIMLKLMRRGNCTESMVEQACTTMERQLEQMVRLVDDLLDMSRITRGKLELRKERVELASVIHQAVDSYRPLAECNGHEFDISLPPEPIYLYADPTRLAQVFGNLLHNACKYTPQGGRIWLTAERQQSDVVVKVKDTGIGIPPDKLESIFELFAQVDRSQPGAKSGLGIGLMLVKRLVEMHGGSVQAHSAGPNAGSEFVIRLPIPTEEPKADADLEEQPPTAPHRILVVDDNADAASSLAVLLRLMGNETQTAHDGLQALETAAVFQPDVVLLDLSLPKLSGYDVCRRIREEPWGGNMVLVALTGWGQDEDRQRTEEAGFNHHMLKPLDFDELMNILAEM